MNWRDAGKNIFTNAAVMANAIADSVLRSRSNIQAKLGATFGGDRKHYEVFGWPVDPTYNLYKFLYQRGGIAKRIIDCYPQACWKYHPEIQEEVTSKNSEKTVFEDAVKKLVRDRNVFSYFERVNKLARLGEYAVLFLGFADGADYEQMKDPVGPVSTKIGALGLLYLQPYGQDKASILKYEMDPQNARFGLPDLYQIQLDIPLVDGSAVPASKTVVVHHSRVIHVAEDVVESDLFGAPALESIINYLLDLEKVHGSAAEAFFQQCPPGLIFSADKDVVVDSTSITDDQGNNIINDYIHDLRRYLFLQGVNVTPISPQIGDPTSIRDMLIELIAGTKGIPKRILVGSERGELSSTQDETAWNQRVAEYQKNWAEPRLLRPFIDRCVDFGVVPKPANGYNVLWRESEFLSEETRAKIAQMKSAAITQYSNASEAQSIIPPKIFLEQVMGFSSDVVDDIETVLSEVWERDIEDLTNPEDTIDDAMSFPEKGQEKAKFDLLEKGVEFEGDQK